MCITANIFFSVLVVTFPIRFAHFCDSGNSNVADSDPEPETEFKEFEPPFKFKLRLKYDWFHLKLYSIFKDLSWRSIKTGLKGIRVAT